MSEIKVRIDTRDDVQNIANFNIIFAKEMTNKKLSPLATYTGVHHVFQTFNSDFYLVAEKNNEIIEMTMLTPKLSDWSNGIFYCIQNMHIYDKKTKQKIHDIIFNEVKDLAKEHSEVCGIRVYINESNKSLQRKYDEHSLKKTEYTIFEEKF